MELTDEFQQFIPEHDTPLDDSSDIYIMAHKLFTLTIKFHFCLRKSFGSGLGLSFAETLTISFLGNI